MASCDTVGVPGGDECVLDSEHDGDHMDRDGDTWPRLVQRDCPRCGALMWTQPGPPSGLPCWACQDEDAAALPEEVSGR